MRGQGRTEQSRMRVGLLPRRQEDGAKGRASLRSKDGTVEQKFREREAKIITRKKSRKGGKCFLSP